MALSCFALVALFLTLFLLSLIATAYFERTAVVQPPRVAYGGLAPYLYSMMHNAPLHPAARHSEEQIHNALPAFRGAAGPAIDLTSWANAG